MGSSYLYGSFPRVRLWLLSAGSPMAHPRLSMVRPLWGRLPRGVASRCGGHSAARGMLCSEAWRPRRGRAMSSLGWSEAEPEVSGQRRWRPRRGRYARGGVWHKRLFEALRRGGARSAGSASLHPRLLIARPPWGRSCCAPTIPSVGHPGGERRDESRLYVADFPCGWVAMMGRCARLCAIWQTVNADTQLRPPFSVGKAARRGARGNPSHGFLFPSHGSADPSLRFCVSWAVSG